jgi:hypothetical protein
MNLGNDTNPQPDLRVTQILVLALIMGLVMFAGVVFFLEKTGQLPPPPANQDPNLSTLLIGVMAVLSITCAPAGYLFRSTKVSALRKRAEQGETFTEPQILAQFQILTVLRAALTEGPALFAIVIVLLTGDNRAFIGAAFGLVIFALIFPSRGKFEAFQQDVTRGS